MKKKIYLVFAVAFAGILLSYSGGSPGGKTDAPGDSGNCSSCHSGNSVNTADWISTNIPASGYVAGTTYTITASGNHDGAAKFGFEVTSQDASGKTGTFVITNSTETKLTNGDNAVTHTSSGNTATSGSKTWSFDWTAPATGTGDVTFYGAFNATNGNGSTSGDFIYTSELLINEDTGVGIKDNENIFTISPNPASSNLTISSNNKISNISIYDISGKIFLEKNNINSKKEDINIDNFSDGVYFIKVEGANFKKIEKIIIKK